MIRIAQLFAVSTLVVSLVASRVDAQSRCPAPTGNPYELCQVERIPIPDSTNVAPRYPDILIAAGLGGTVRAQFVIDSAGRVVPGSFSAAESSHDMFLFSVKSTVVRWRFSPALLGGHPVSVRYYQVVDFVSPPEPHMPPLTQIILTRDPTSAGTPRIRIGFPERGVIDPRRFSEQELYAVQLMALAEIAPAGHVDDRGIPRVTVCLTILRAGEQTPADSATRSTVASKGRRVVVPAQCPHTYASMVYDSKHRPPAGWIDPYITTVTRAEPWNAEFVLVEVAVAQGITTRGYRCWLMPTDAVRRPACTKRSFGIS